MKKSILNVGKALNRAEQKSVFGGGKFKNPCPCTSSFVLDPDGSCSYPAASGPLFGQGRCLGTVQNNLCCV